MRDHSRLTGTSRSDQLPILGLRPPGSAAGRGRSRCNAAIAEVVLNRDQCIEAVFGTALTVGVTGGGTVLAQPAVPVYPFGTPIQLTALPSADRYFGSWGGAASGNANPLNFVVTNPGPTVSAAILPLTSG